MRSRKIIHALMRRIRCGEDRADGDLAGRRAARASARRLPAAAQASRSTTLTSTRGWLRSKSIALGTTYAEGLWDSDELLELLLIVTREIGRADPLRRRIAPLLIPFQRLGTLKMLNTRRKAREHISSHYDAGNDMFELFLDRENMMYSSAYFEHDEQSLEDAQLGSPRAHLRAARARPRRSPARDRHRLGRDGDPRRDDPRLPGDDDDDLRRAARLRAAARPRGRPRRPGSGARRRLPRSRLAATTSSSRSR